MEGIMMVRYPQGGTNDAEFKRLKGEAEAMGFKVLGFAYDHTKPAPPSIEFLSPPSVIEDFDQVQ